MIRFIDFVPAELQKAGFLRAAVMEQFEDCLQRANAWIDQHGVEVMNIETVVLPNMHGPDEEGSIGTKLHTQGEWPVDWYQFIRIWYR